MTRQEEPGRRERSGLLTVQPSEARAAVRPLGQSLRATAGTRLLDTPTSEVNVSCLSALPPDRRRNGLNP